MKKVNQFLAFSLFALSIIVLLLGPVSILQVSLHGENPVILFRLPVSLSQQFTTVYIHSVQKTPVEDEYFIQGEKLWQWEERFVSHNAGLPVDVPRNSSFLEDKNWMIIRGGRSFFDSLYYRVGTQMLGRNHLVLPGSGEWALYRLCPGERLVFHAAQEPLLWALTGARFPEEKVCP